MKWTSPAGSSFPCLDTRVKGFIGLGEFEETLLEIDLLFPPSVWNLDGAMNLEAKIYLFRICIRLRVKARLSNEVLDIDGENTRIFIQLQETAAIDTKVVVEHEYAEPDLEDKF